jgi:RimJ/RimL family protein N-acetyltransferase
VPLGTRRQGPRRGAGALSSDLDSAQPSTYRCPDTLRDAELLLRGPTAADVDVIAPAFRDPEVGGEAGLPPVGAERLRLMLRDELPALRAQGFLVPYVVEDTDTDELLGGTNFSRFDPFRDSIELGYWLFVNARGRGVATRSVQSMTEHALTNGILRVEAVVRIGNVVSERVLERAGFEREGVKRRLLRHGGVRVDATLFARVGE